MQFQQYVGNRRRERVFLFSAQKNVKIKTKRTIIYKAPTHVLLYCAPLLWGLLATLWLCLFCLFCFSCSLIVSLCYGEFSSGFIWIMLFCFSLFFFFFQTRVLSWVLLWISCKDNVLCVCFNFYFNSLCSCCYYLWV